MPSTSRCRAADVGGLVAGPAALSVAGVDPRSLSWQSSRALPRARSARVRAPAGRGSRDTLRSGTEAAAERFATLPTPHAHDPPPRSHHHPRRPTTKADAYFEARRAEWVTAFERAHSHHHARRRGTEADAYSEARRARWVATFATRHAHVHSRRSHRPRAAFPRPAAATPQASTAMHERPRRARGHPRQSRHRARRSTTGCDIRTTVHDNRLTAHGTPAVILGKYHHARRPTTVHGRPSIVRGRFRAGCGVIGPVLRGAGDRLSRSAVRRSSLRPSRPGDNP